MVRFGLVWGNIWRRLTAPRSHFQICNVTRLKHSQVWQAWTCSSFKRGISSVPEHFYSHSTDHPLNNLMCSTAPMQKLSILKTNKQYFSFMLQYFLSVRRQRGFKSHIVTQHYQNRNCVSVCMCVPNIFTRLFLSLFLSFY